MKLNSYQKKALGVKKENDVENFIWNISLAKNYGEIDERNANLGDQGQTYPQFLKMEKRPPNEFGTGRYKFSYINKIQVIFIPKRGLPQPKGDIKEIICKFLQIYLRINCENQPSIKMQVHPQRALIDKKKNLQYTIQYSQGMADAHEVLSVLLEYHQQKTILVAFLEQQLHEEGAAIDGRAYGDGVAVVYFSRNDLSQKLELYLQTLVHETLHTLGFDHCLAWKCMMNGYTNFQSWLCPACSKKLYHELGLNSSSQIIEWMSQLLQLYEKLKFKKTIRKGNKIIEAIRDHEE